MASIACPRSDSPVEAALPDRGRAFGPLEPHHVEQVAQAHRRARPIRRAASFARLSGRTTLLCGLLAIPFGLASLTTLALGLALVWLGLNELHARRALLRLESDAPSRLGWNQILLAGVLVAYGAFGLWKHTGAESGLAAALASEPAFADLTARVEQVQRLAVNGVYGGVIVGAILFQGAAARFYFRRNRLLSRHLRDTEGWIVELQRRLAP